jgi:BirA family biotin operon repressor/biotin-[acetyl-CoA-carboxylase] ligase
MTSDVDGLGFAPGQVLSGPVDLRLAASVVGGRIHYLVSVDSTNAVLRKLAEEGEQEGAVVVADEQTAGRGRSGRSWHSPAGAGLWLSVLLKPGRAAREVTPLSMVTAISVATVLRRDFGVDARVKWPNDVWVGRLKLAGILLESLQGVSGEVERLIVGIGLNVNLDVEALPAEVAERATSMSAALGRPVPRLEVLRSVLDGLDEDWRTFESAGFAGFRERWRELSATLGKRIEIRQYEPPADAPSKRQAAGVLAGKVVDITEAGALVVADEDGARVEVWHGDLVWLE